MNEFEVVAQPRDALGTGASRRLRRMGRVPGVLYGGSKDPAHISVDGNRIRKQLENEAFAAHILAVKIEDEESQAVLKSIQRDPATDQVIHMDFQRISASSEIHMRVPLHFVNEDVCAGKKAGGIVTHLLVEVEVGCLPKDLPEYVEVDMAALGIGESVHLSELALPEGVRLMALAQNPDNDPPIVSVQHPQKLADEGEGEAPAEEDASEAPAPGAEPG